MMIFISHFSVNFSNFFFSKSSILNVDKNRKHFNPHFKYEDFKKIVENLIWMRFCINQLEGVKDSCCTKSVQIKFSTFLF